MTIQLGMFNGLQRPEQLDGLIYQMTTEIVQQAAGLAGRRGIPPVAEPFRHPPGKARLKNCGCPQFIVFDQEVRQSNKIRI